MDLQDDSKILQVHIGRGCGSGNGCIFQKLHPKQAVCQHCLFQPGAVLLEGIWRGEEIKAVGTACPDFVISADKQGMGDTFRIQQIDLAVFHEQFRAVTGADALQYKIGFPPDFPEEGCRPDAGTQEDGTAQEKKALSFWENQKTRPVRKQPAPTRSVRASFCDNGLGMGSMDTSSYKIWNMILCLK